jgi:iron complex outermembrane receptor protein
MTLRGTYAKFFRAPNLPDRLENLNTSGVLTLPDASALGGVARALVWTGNNADLVAERGRSWTLGFDFKSAAVPGLAVGLTYFDTRLINRVEETPFSLDATSDPLYATYVTRNPTAAERAQVCDHSSFQSVGFDCRTVPVGLILDLRLHNAATVITRGFDLAAEYRVATVLGQLKLGLLATDLLEFSRTAVAGGPLQNLLNTENEPIDLRLRASATWDYRGFGLMAFLNFTDSYRQFITDSRRTVASWTTLDLRLSYELGDMRSASGSAQVALNVQNLFNRPPPLLNNPLGVGYDEENGDLLGRVVSLNVRYRW